MHCYLQLKLFSNFVQLKQCRPVFGHDKDVTFGKKILHIALNAMNTTRTQLLILH